MPGEITEHPAPRIDADLYITPILREGDGAAVAQDSNHDRPSIYTQADGSPWKSEGNRAAPVNRMMVRRGKWNNV